MEPVPPGAPRRKEEPAFVSAESLRQLDWPWFIEQIRLALRTAPAREACEERVWTPDREAALQTMQEVEEARVLLRAGKSFTLGNPPDIRPLEPRIRKGAVLRQEELLDVASWMETVEALRRFLVVHRREAPLLYRHAEGVPSFSHLVYDIRSCIDEKGEVRDEASPELATLRRRSRRLHEKIHQRLRSYLTARELQVPLQDKFYTIKEDRYVLPIKTHQRSSVDGIVLGSSQSGATLFIEPREIVELNNEYKLALVETEREITRILLGICDNLRRDASDFDRGHAFLERIDLLQARAVISERLKAEIPTMDADKGIRLLQARHPFLVLTGAEVVPNDILLLPPVRTLLITGPNAGGKTVLLKTVGILALMVRAGFALPAAADSNLPFFDMVFSDIGDNQSLAEHRSTFSGHLARIVDLLSSIRPTTLALLDEIVIGTDPEEGSSLARAILEHLTEQGIYTLATTHFLSLKTLAATDPHIQNASFGFDPRTQEPTYRLTPGMPGSSNALEVAGRLGLPAPILERARALRGKERLELDRLLAQIEAVRQEAERERELWRRRREEAEARWREAQERLARVEERERELKRKYRERLEAAYREALREIDRLRRRPVGASRPSAAAEAARELRRHRERLLSEQGEFEAPPPGEEGEEVDWAEIRPGDPVYLPELKAQGKVVSPPDRKGMVTLEVKGFRTQVESAKVRRPIVEKRVVPGRPPAEPPSEGAGAWRVEARRDRGGAETDEGRCDLRGLTVEEALERTSRALDKAFLERRPRLVLIHGLGKGVLRDAVRRALSTTPYPLTFRPGRREEGGDGVTVVEFEATAFPA